jgi:nucleotide-binding universal stress UspA family protein
MISNVAVGTDGSATAEEAVKQAADLARRFGARLVLLSAFPGPGGFAAHSGVGLEWASSSQAQVRAEMGRANAASARNMTAASRAAARM